MNLRALTSVVLSLTFCTFVFGQSIGFSAGTLDPTRSIQTPDMDSSAGTPLPEQYIWTQTGSEKQSNSAQGISTPTVQPNHHYFRDSFAVARIPAQATLYVAGPGSVDVYLNGKLVLHAQANPSSPLKMQMFTADLRGALLRGNNTLAVQAIRNSGLRPVSEVGKTLVAKIVPAGRGIVAPPLVVTNAQWKSTTILQNGWQQTKFDDAAWPKVHALGPINGDIDYLQWNRDAGLYNWPGYSGVSPFLASYQMLPKEVDQVFEGSGKIVNVAALTTSTPTTNNQEFTVSLAKPMMMEQDAPSIVLDFGKEVVGWVELLSDSAQAGTVTVQYGESEGEMQHEPYLGIDPVFIPAHGTAHGPKSAFRYVKIRFLQASGPLLFHAIRLHGIYYPVKYQGSFTSSDALLNQIWEVGAYTAHLCMQDDIWDAPKRDRGRWMGDLDVSGNVIDSVFADHFLMQDTMARLIGTDSITRDINGIPGYSAFWVMGMADYNLHTNSPEYIAKMHDQLVQLLSYMEGELGPDHLYANPHKAWPFVDWSPYLDTDTPEARMATDFEFYRAFTQGAALLRQLQDTQNAAHFEQLARTMKQAAQEKYLDQKTGTFGTRWQTNAMAIYSGLADKTQYDSIWRNVLSTVNTTPYTAFIISPYYNYYVIQAMAETDHRAEALEWIRKYWGGMIAEGATSFWEAYDPSWPKRNPHASLQADGSAGYFVSLAHGWSTGPTVWLMEQILGIHPTSDGFREVTIRPDLAGLAWAKGAEPTPYGLIRVNLKSGPEMSMSLDIPVGIRATVLVPAEMESFAVMVNGKPQLGQFVEGGHRVAIVLPHGGHFDIRAAK